MVIAISMMPFERLIVLEHLLAAGATPRLLLQDFGTTCRRRLERQLSLAVLNIRFPLGVEGVSVALDLNIPLLCKHLLHADDLCAGGRVGNAPRLPRAVGEVTRREPATGVVWVTACSPSIQPSPDEAVKCRKRLATDDVVVVVCPPPPHGVQGIDEVLRRGPRSLFTEGLDLGCDGLEAGLAGSNLPLGPLAVAPCMFTPGLAPAVNALREGRDDRLRRRQPYPALCENGGDPWQDGVF